ncbi:uncharacterized protein EI90DRAFT_3229921 [Cantharellus anzutake]|uniref:uncharacterized protein n=1 Tax=Cantharellus anzutake TaxID=1750568 RepID=UPI0019089185|nr:uncharacterized protein EI90DRAFT_3229921 [Cantharellus anzutake]KAF8326350.1 hypothetical protein EI90DRAFT_3229921 [Cantharellus anzutake]
MIPSTKELVDKWLSLDQNQATRAEIQALWDGGNIEELDRRLRNRIGFGTAGLRGRMEAGFSRMNDVTIIQASQGLASYTRENVAHATERGVVIGHDHRHNSERWARLTAGAFVQAGFKVFLLRGLVHTPLVPFSVAHLKAACGVMITASHNPKDDNGYKVYWDNAVQIVEPHDKGIAAAIVECSEPLIWDTSTALGSPDVTAGARKAYFETLRGLSYSHATNQSCMLDFVNTSMHGVGHEYVVQAFETFNFPPFGYVEAQRAPDPEFPTVPYPNPEEKGALDLALRQANVIGASYILAQDPDADRFAAGQRINAGEWRIFSGDQLGTLLAWWILYKYQESGNPIEKLAMVASTVSSKMLEAMARIEGFKFAESLTGATTGFKYIGNTALALEKQGYDVQFGYEEAIGYMHGTAIRDKDGISATMCFAELAAHLHARGATAYDHLQSLYDRYGYFQTSNSYFICNEPSTINRIFARLRHYNDSPDVSEPRYPSTLGGLRVIRVRDLTLGHAYDSENAPLFKPDFPLSGGHMITFRAKGAGDKQGTPSIVLTIRTSGTEPKIKYYLEGSAADRHLVGTLLEAAVEELNTEWMEADKNGLEMP